MCLGRVRKAVRVAVLAGVPHLRDPRAGTEAVQQEAQDQRISLPLGGASQAPEAVQGLLQPRAPPALPAHQGETLQLPQGRLPEQLLPAERPRSISENATRRT